MIKIIIFDLDDTLIESRKNYIATCVKAAEVMGIRVPTEEDFIWYGDSWHDFIRQTWPDTDPEAFDLVYTDLARQIVYNRFKGVNTTLNILKKQYDLYILTKRSRTFLDLRLAQSGIDMTAIKKIFTSEEMAFQKPDPRAFDVLEPHLGELDRAQVLYVGDHLGDMQAAHGAGLKFVAVLTGYFSRQAFMENGLSQRYIIDDVAQLPAWLMAEKEIEP
jgi:phosphoglycolate phosphatase/pyrophosphatase PpaX